MAEGGRRVFTFYERFIHNNIMHPTSDRPGRCDARAASVRLSFGSGANRLQIRAGRCGVGFTRLWRTREGGRGIGERAMATPRHPVSHPALSPATPARRGLTPRSISRMKVGVVVEEGDSEPEQLGAEVCQ